MFVFFFEIIPNVIIMLKYKKKVPIAMAINSQTILNIEYPISHTIYYYV